MIYFSESSTQLSNSELRRLKPRRSSSILELVCSLIPNTAEGHLHARYLDDEKV